MFRIEVDHFLRLGRRLWRNKGPILLALGITLGSGVIPAARAQEASVPCTFPFLLSLDEESSQSEGGQQIPPIPPELQNPQTTVTITATGPQKKVKNVDSAQGNVVVTYRAFRLSADEVTYDETSGEVVARGHVAFTDPRATLQAEEAHYNVQTGKGWFSNGRGYFHTAARPSRRVVASPNPFYVEARRVDRADEDTYTVERGRVSSCNEEQTGWSLSARKIRLDVGRKIVARDALLRLVGVPVFYAPVIVDPVAPRQRQTGFLLPHIGNSTQKGYILGDGFFWAINPSADLLVGLEDYSKRGLARRARFRARPSDTSDLNVEYYGINDKTSGALGLQRAPGNSVRAIGEASNLGYGFRGVLDFDYISSLAFREVWSETFTQAVNSEVHQTAFLTKNFEANSLSFYASRYENFLCANARAQLLGVTNPGGCPPAIGSRGFAGNSVTIRQLPGMSFSRMDTELGDSPFYFSVDASASGVGRNQPGFGTPELSDRLTLYPEISVRSRPVMGFYFTPTIGLDAVHYGTSLRPDHSPINRALGDFSADLRPPQLEKIFKRQFWGHRIKHVIEPEIRYHLVRASDKEDIGDIVRFDQADILSETNEIEYSLTNTLMARKSTSEDSDGSGGLPQARDVLSLRLSQKYYFDPTFGGALVPGQKIMWGPTVSLTGFAFAQGRHWSPIVSVLKVAPFSNYDTEVRADIDPSYGGVLNAGITSRVHRGLFSLAFTDFVLNRTAVLFTLPPPGTPLRSFNLLRTVATYGDVNRKGFSGAFGLDYNFAQGIAQQLVSQVSYNFGCFGLDMEYRRFALGTLRRDNSYRLGISLSNVGTFGNLKPRERLY